MTGWEQVLRFEETAPRDPVSKALRIRAEFGISTARYYRRLGVAVDEPGALLVAPSLVARLRRIRDERRRRRFAAREISEEGIAMAGEPAPSRQQSLDLDGQAREVGRGEPGRDLYGGLPPHERPGTSVAAAVEIIPAVRTLRTRVLDLIASSGPSGLTDDEIERITGLRHQTASARRRELVLLGLVVDSGQRRRTSSGRSAAVWIHAEGRREEA